MAKGIAVSTEIHTKLAALRRSLRGRLAGEGLAWLIVALVGAVFVTLGIDYTLRPEDPLYRIAMSCTALAAIAWVAWRELLGPLLAPMDAEDLALLIERRHKTLGDRLISALQFIRSGGAAPNESHAMVAETVRQANAMAAPVELGGIVERENLKRVALIALCTVCLLGGFSAWQSTVMARWLQRNVVFADVDYPQNTYLRIEGGPVHRVLRGAELEITILVDAESTSAPDHVIVHAHYPSLADESDDGWSEERVELAGVSESGRDYYTIRFRRVTEEFSFYVVGGDDHRMTRSKDTAHHKVSLIDRPALADMTFRGTYPLYLLHEQADAGDNEDGPRISDSLGTVTVPAGTTLTLTATGTKDLAAARVKLTCKGDPDVTPGPVELSSRETGGPLRIVRWTHKFDVPTRKKDRRRALTYEVEFMLIDTEGNPSDPAGCGERKISVQLDRSPNVKTKRRVTIAGDMATAEAIIPLNTVFEDDHNLATAQALMAVVKGKKRTLEPVHVPLRRPGERAVVKKRSVAHEIDLKSYGLVAGDELAIEIAADDSLPAFLGGPNIGRSVPVGVRIVRRDVLEGKLVEAGRTAILEFVQAIALQRAVRDGTATAGTLLAGDDGVEAAKFKLAGAARQQGAIARECTKVADAMANILEARVLNRLGTEEAHQSVRNKIIEPLKALPGPLGEISAALERAAMLGDADRLGEQIVSMTAAQDAVLVTMNGILTEMEKDSTRQYIINRWGMIVDWSKDQLKGIEKHSDAQTGSVFDDKDKDKDGKKDKTKDGGS